MACARPRDDPGRAAALSDEDDESGIVPGPMDALEQNKNTPTIRDSFLRGSGPDQQAHKQAEVVTRDMDQIALVNVFPAPQPCAAHPTPVQHVSKGALHDLRAFAQGLLADLGSQPDAIVVNRPACLVVSMPTREALALGLGNS